MIDIEVYRYIEVYLRYTTKKWLTVTMVTMNEANIKCKLRFPSLSAIPIVADGG